MSLVLKRIVWPDGSSRPDDFNIMYDDTVLGRVPRLGCSELCSLNERSKASARKQRVTSRSLKDHPTAENFGPP
jgi:hypothetical protein